MVLGAIYLCLHCLGAYDRAKGRSVVCVLYMILQYRRAVLSKRKSVFAYTLRFRLGGSIFTDT